MRALIQRDTRASVVVEGQEVGSIGPGPGMVVLLGVAVDDQEADAKYLVEKLVNLRIFPGDDGRQDARLRKVGKAGMKAVHRAQPACLEYRLDILQAVAFVPEASRRQLGGTEPDS